MFNKKIQKNHEKQIHIFPFSSKFSMLQSTFWVLQLSSTFAGPTRSPAFETWRPLSHARKGGAASRDAMGFSEISPAKRCIYIHKETYFGHVCIHILYTYKTYNILFYIGMCMYMQHHDIRIHRHGYCTSVGQLYC